MNDARRYMEGIKRQAIAAKERRDKARSPQLVEPNAFRALQRGTAIEALRRGATKKQVIAHLQISHRTLKRLLAAA